VFFFFFYVYINIVSTHISTQIKTNPKYSSLLKKVSKFYLVPSRAAIIALTFSTEVEGATSRARVLPARDLTKSCIANKKEEELNTCKWLLAS
jgi:hypothetical protein